MSNDGSDEEIGSIWDDDKDEKKTETDYKDEVDDEGSI